MKEYLFHWQFWAAVIIVTFVAHWAMMKFMPSGGTS